MISIDEELRTQSAIIDIADAWMEKHDGVVMPGVTVSRREWIEQMQQLPLWSTIRENIQDFVRFFRLQTIRLDSKEGIGKTAYLLDNALRAKHTLQHFLADPDYCCDSSNVYGSPKKLSSVLRDYSTAYNLKGEWTSSEGNCNRLIYIISEGGFSEDILLNAVGLTEQWRGYQQTKGITREHRAAAKSTLEHFLAHPDYCTEKGANKFGAPRKLASVLRDYCSTNNGSDAEPVRRKGDCEMISKKMGVEIAERDLLQQIGLTEAWGAYQKSTGLPREYLTIGREVLSHFLSRPDYCHGKDNAFGAPKNLRTILRDYSPILNEGDGGYDSSRGRGLRIYQAMVKGLLAESAFLDMSCMREAWEQYQATTGLPRQCIYEVREIFGQFLARPQYCSAGGPGNRIGGPKSFMSVLRAKSTKIPSYVAKGKISVNDLIKGSGLQNSWSDYQQSSVNRPYIYIPEPVAEVENGF